MYRNRDKQCGRRMRMGRHGHGPGGERGGRRGGGRMGRGRRPLQHGDLRLLLLSLIAERPRHGYDLISAIDARTGGAYAPSPGVVYPTLEMMLDMGWVSVEEDEGRKTFHPTPAGLKALEDDKATVEEIEARLHALAADDLRQAAQAMRHHLRSHRDDWSAEKREKAASILTSALEELKALDDEG